MGLGAVRSAGGARAGTPINDEVDRNARTLSGRVSRIVFRNDESGWTVLALGPHKAAGELTAPAVGLEYQLTGAWDHHARYGWTFKFTDALPIEPTTEEGLCEYLIANAPGIGRRIAETLIATFGQDVIATLRSDPEQVAAKVRGLTLERARIAQRALQARESIEKAEVALRAICAPASVPRRCIRAILERFGGESAEVLRRDPYALIGTIPLFGWKTADRVARQLGHEPTSSSRLRAGILYAFSQAEKNDGHTCMSEDAAATVAVHVLAVPRDAVTCRMRELVEEGELVELEVPPSSDAERAPGGEVRLFRSDMFEAERTIATVVLRLTG